VELIVPDYSAVSIFFVTSLHMYYTKQSIDPIFPADKAVYFPGDNEPWWQKSDPISRPFLCFDQRQICAPSGGPCWFFDEKPKLEDNQLTSAYWLMKLALENSGMYESIVYRLGNALKAQERVSQFNSIPLKYNHWMEEAERMFATSLARAQIDAWNIASGEDADKKHYEDWTPSEAGDLCGLFKFHTSNYTNLSVPLLWIFFLVIPLGAFILSLEQREVCRIRNKPCTKIKSARLFKRRPRTSLTPADNNDEVSEAESSTAKNLDGNNPGQQRSASGHGLRSSNIPQGASDEINSLRSVDLESQGDHAPSHTSDTVQSQETTHSGSSHRPVSRADLTDTETGSESDRPPDSYEPLVIDLFFTLPYRLLRRCFNLFSRVIGTK